MAPQNAEIRTVAKSLLIFLKCSAKRLFLKRLYQTVENLKYVLSLKLNKIEGLLEFSNFISYFCKRQMRYLKKQY